MFKIYNLKDKTEYMEEVACLTQREWGLKDLSKEEFELKVKNKITKIKSNFNRNNYCKLILLDNDILVGFISIFPTDGDEKQICHLGMQQCLLKKNIEEKAILKY